MYQVDVDNDYRSTAKRARTGGYSKDGSDDWTCPTCGNVNFSFRKICRVRNCTQRRSDPNAKPWSMPIKPPQPNTSNPCGKKSPPRCSIFSGLSNSGSIIYPPYGCPYRPMPLYGPPPPQPPYSGAAMMRKAVPGTNEWICPYCGRANLSFRKKCYHKKCRKPKPGAQPPNPEQTSIENVPDGSWKCEQCGNQNFSFRTKCNTKNCGSDKPSGEKVPDVPDGSWKCEQCDNINSPCNTKCITKNCGAKKSSEENIPDGSWKCVRCGIINFPFRTKCYMENCGSSKPSEKGPLISASSKPSEQGPLFSASQEQLLQQLLAAIGCTYTQV